MNRDVMPGHVMALPHRTSVSQRYPRYADGFKVDAQRWSRPEKTAPLLDPGASRQGMLRHREDDISSLTS